MTTKQLTDARRARAKLADAQDHNEIPRDPRDRLVGLREWYKGRRYRVTKSGGIQRDPAPTETD